MMSRTWLLLAMAALMTFDMIGQTNNLTGSPYSLFGLGVSTNSNIGKNSALGRGGYALEPAGFINNYNPASYAAVSEKNFMYDIGFLAELSTVSNRNNEERRLAGNMSSLAIASSISKKSGLGLTLDPYSDVGYAVVGIEGNIEGSFEKFSSNIFGSGGLNDLKLSYGYSINEHINVGLGISYLFGSIDETERINTGTSSLNVQETNRYFGARIDFGVQGKLNDYFAIGARWQLPTSLAARRDRNVSKSTGLLPNPEPVENTSDITIPSFDLPLEIGTGLAISPWSSLTLNLDYTGSYWGATDQHDNIGTFVDRNVYAFGMEYLKDETSFKFWERIGFRAGFNYDSGYLQVNDETVGSYSITGGLGIPIGRSTLNLSYAYRGSGSSEGIQVQETFHTINVNISLRDIWFLKRKVN
ncbi:hypothetical protein FK220_009560 [Flavobacteriaceae bacterium TP-CH-4]|uniref:Long-chain fatty acid transport protein n=1 Tax=Pelagihabitans pacificus TaxID=2696054 RepID=A0A967ASK6_9FLAO|nr:hypothetical protein [Pelagihabitans pacificus]NHF59586.1 hypothetical protein [Pelagihabitans pacificus]